MNLQEHYDRLLQEEFVGRDAEVEQFLSNLSLPLGDHDRRFIFSIYGPKGVGKSTLLRRFRHLALEESNAPVAAVWINENAPTLLDALSRIAEPFSLPRFRERLEFYQAEHRRLKTAAPVSEQWQSPVTVPQPTDLHRKIGEYFSLDELRELCLDLGIEYEDLSGDTRRVKAISLVEYCNRYGCRAALLERCAALRPHVDWRDVVMVTDMRTEIQANALWEAHVRRHLSEEADVLLLLDPVTALTPLLLTELRPALSSTTLLIFVDGYERKRSFLEPWLCGLLNGRFGPVPAQIVITLAGEEMLSGGCWDDYQHILVHLPLAPFTEDEARAFLNIKGIDDDQEIDDILNTLKKSAQRGYLMLDLATAVASGAMHTAGYSRKSRNAVTLFLKSIEEKHLREATIQAAFARRFNASILALLLGHDDVASVLTWLIVWPFVKTAGDHAWLYHDNMRSDILAYSRNLTTFKWPEMHDRLTAYYLGQRAAISPDNEPDWNNAAWQEATLEIAYHRLCQSRASRRRHLSTVLGDFLYALQVNEKFADQWAQAIEQAGADAGSGHVQEWGHHLRQGIQAYVTGEYAETAVMLSRLLERKTLEDQHRVIALRWRGDVYRHLRDDAKAIADYDAALVIDPQYAWAYAGRAETYRWMEKYGEAAADFDKAIELEPNFVWAVAHRGELYRKLDQKEKALADFNRAIELDPNLAWVIASRGELYRSLEQYTYALADLNQAITLNPTYGWAYAGRGQTYRKLGQYEAALADFNQAVSLNPDYYWAIAGRAQTWRKLAHYQEAVADFTRAVELNPAYAWALAERGKTYRLMGEYDKALADFNQAIELDPNYHWALAGRGETYRLIGDTEKALADFDQALAKKPDDPAINRQRQRLLKKRGG